MPNHKKCIIDNWSLEHAGILLEGSIDLGERSDEFLVKNIGGLSNFINAILLYDNSYFLINGFENDWKKFAWFDTNTSSFIEGIQLDELAINWTSQASYDDIGIRNYLVTSRYFESDLLICPERSEDIAINNTRLENAFVETLTEIDNRILHERDKSIFSKIKIGIDRNFKVPSLTQYVFAETSRREDLLTVIMQLKSDGKIEKVLREIEEMTSTVKRSGKFEQDIQDLIKKAFGRKINQDNNASIGVSAYGVGLSKSLNANFFRRSDTSSF